MTTTLRKLALGVAAAGLAWAGAALAQSAETGGTQMMGKVKQISHSDSSISVRSPDRKDEKLKVGSDTAVVKDGRRATFDDIEPGDQVRASMSSSGDCTRLDVTSADAKSSTEK